MLKGIDYRLNGNLLRALQSMGHGDTIVVVDANFPADAVGRATVLGKALTIENVGAPEAANAILSVLPLDTFVDDFAVCMEVVGEPDTVMPVMEEIQAEIDAAEGASRPMMKVDRFAFYDLAREAYAVVATSERRFYGNVMLRKGVIPPES
jgi:L-fucose mutarotase